jgi:glutamine amidotransferase
MVAIIDYGMGNIRSIENAILEVGGNVKIVSDPDKLNNYDKLLLPGVGAFGHAITSLRKTGMDQALDLFKDSGKSIIGVCLGMQLMCLNSGEDGHHIGLGWFDAEVKLFPKGKNIRIPHMGWNNVSFTRENPILNKVESGQNFYFVHSYFVNCNNDIDILGYSDHGITFSSIILKENLIGMQFHPEKSQKVGLQIIKNLLEI